VKLLVVSDIHANWPALHAIQEDADAVVCLGDIISYGPFPRECVAWVRERATHVIRGNHDTALSHGGDPGAAVHKHALALATLENHRRLLSVREMAWLGELPTNVRFRCDDYTFHAFHASPRDHLFIDLRLSNATLRAKKGEVRSARCTRGGAPARRPGNRLPRSGRP
jgi:predicted phosphodiesterase